MPGINIAALRNIIAEYSRNKSLKRRITNRKPSVIVALNALLDELDKTLSPNKKHQIELLKHFLDINQNTKSKTSSKIIGKMLNHLNSNILLVILLNNDAKGLLKYLKKEKFYDECYPQFDSSEEIKHCIQHGKINELVAILKIGLNSKSLQANNIQVNLENIFENIDTLLEKPGLNHSDDKVPDDLAIALLKMKQENAIKISRHELKSIKKHAYAYEKRFLHAIYPEIAKTIDDDLQAFISLKEALRHCAHDLKEVSKLSNIANKIEQFKSKLLFDVAVALKMDDIRKLEKIIATSEGILDFTLPFLPVQRLELNAVEEPAPVFISNLLAYAIKHSNLKMVNHILNKNYCSGHETGCTTDHFLAGVETTPINYAIFLGKTNIVKALVTRGYAPTENMLAIIRNPSYDWEAKPEIKAVLDIGDPQKALKRKPAVSHQYKRERLALKHKNKKTDRQNAIDGVRKNTKIKRNSK